MALPHGTIVNGYQIDQVLGSGGFGITYLAHDLLGQRFAIKEYYPRQFAVRQEHSVVAASAEDVALFDECRERFLREAQALVVLGRAASGASGIVRVQTYFETHGTCFLVMDYIEGASLAAVLRQEPTGLAAPRVRSLLIQLLSSIRIVHRAGLMHRDIKPANIILRDDDRVVLIDFGSTRQAARSEQTFYTQIYSGGYAPPEQMLGERQGEYSDIYAIGAVCYRLIGGAVVDALVRQNAVAAGRDDPQPAAVQIGAGRYPTKLLAAIDAALAIDATQRPKDVDAMLAALGPDESGDDATLQATWRAPVAPAQRRRPGAWSVAAGVGALALIGAGYWALRPPVMPPSVSHQDAIVTPVPPANPPVSMAREQPLPAPPAQPQPAPLPLATTDSAPNAITATQQTPENPHTTEQTVSPPVEQQQREAIVVPSPSGSVSPPPPSPIEVAQLAAQSVPCSVLHVAGTSGGMRVSGFAASGQELDRLLAQLRDAGSFADDITRIDRFACGPIATVAAPVRETWNLTPPTLAIRLDQRNVVSGSRLAINVTTALPVLYVDLYQADGLVRHLLRPSATGVVSKLPVEWIATPPSGSRLVLAIGAARPLELGSRPETEKTADYLAALQPRLQGVVADLAMVQVRVAEPVAKVLQPRPGGVRSDKCANIVSRAQLGETLSDAEIAALRTECRS
jgi:serine/threonine protein kinase